MAAIIIEKLSKTYRGKPGRQIKALDGLTLSVQEGEVFGFLGPNGAGKSTTIKTLVGQIQPTTGTVLLHGQLAGTPQALRRVGYLPENPSFYDFLTAREYLDLVGLCFGMPSELLERESARVLELLALTAAADRQIRGYSKGMVQRLGLAQALLHDPDLYILDEPMSGLDPVGRALVKQIMLDLKQAGKTVFFSTHVIADVEAVCDRVGIVTQGRLQFVQDVGAVLQSGIIGYVVEVSGCEAAALEIFPCVSRHAGRVEVTVEKERFQAFMEILIASGGQVELIDTQRKSLEALFLEIVDKTS